MTEEDRSGSLSFKGQMAARYKERMSMGFALGTSFHGVHESELNSTELHLAEGNAASQAAVTKAQDNRSDLLTKTRSKSSLGEHTPDIGPTATNNEATIFGGKSLTSAHIAHIKNHEAESSNMSENELRSSSTGIKAVLDHSQPVSEVSSRRNLNSKVYTTSSGPSHTKTSEISLNVYKTASEQLSLQDHSKSLDKNNTEYDKCQNKEGSILTNTSRDCAKLNSQSKVSEPSSDDLKDDNVRSRNLDPSSQFSNTGRLSEISSSKDQNLSVSQTESLKTSSTIPPPLRINLRTHAARRKVDRLNLYVVHKKEPVKPTLARRHVPRVGGSGVREKSGEVPRHMFTGIKETGDKSMKEGQEKSAVTSSGGGDRGLTLPPVSLMRQKFDVKNWRRQHFEHFDKDDVKTGQEKRRTTVLERYLQFLKANNSPLPQLSSNSMKKELWKASRPPTPRSTSSTRKGSCTSSKASLQNTKETTKCVTDLNIATSLNNLKGIVPEKQISHSDAQAEIQSITVPASKLSTKEHGKDSNIVDQVWNLPVSSSNSIISSSWGDKKMASPSTKITQKKLEQPSGKCSNLTRKSPSTNCLVSGKILSHVHSSMPELSSTIQTSKKEDSSTKFKPFHLPTHRITPARTQEKEREKFSKPSASSAKDRSSNLPVQVDSAKHPSLKESPAVGGRKENTFHLGTNDKRPRILTNAAFAHNKLATDCLKDLHIQNLSGSLTALFSSSDDSDVLPTNKPISPEVLNIREFTAIPEAGADKPALIDTLQTQYLARRKPVCANQDFKIQKGSFSQRNTAQADCIKYLLNHRLVKIPTAFQGSFVTASLRERMEIDSNMRTTSPRNKYSLLHGSSPQVNRLVTHRHPPAVVMTSSNAELVQMARKKLTKDGKPTQQEEPVTRGGDARQKQAENTKYSLLHGSSPQVNRLVTPRHPPAVVMTSSNAELVQMARKKLTKDGKPTQQEEPVTRGGDARQKQAENTKYSLLHGSSPQVNRLVTHRHPPAVVMTSSNSELVQMARKKLTKDGQSTQQEEPVARGGDARQKQAENTLPSQPANNTNKLEARQVPDKVEKAPSDFPIKKKRKADKDKNVKRKKKKKKDDGVSEITVNDGIHSMQKITQEKPINKKKGNDSADIPKETIEEVQKPDAHEQSEKLDQADKSDRVEKDVHKELQEGVLGRKDKVKKTRVRKAEKRETSDISKFSGESYKSKKIIPESVDEFWKYMCLWVHTPSVTRSRLSLSLDFIPTSVKRDIEALSHSMLHSQEGKPFVCGDSPVFSKEGKLFVSGDSPGFSKEGKLFVSGDSPGVSKEGKLFVSGDSPGVSKEGKPFVCGDSPVFSKEGKLFVSGDSPGFSKKGKPFVCGDSPGFSMEQEMVSANSKVSLTPRLTETNKVSRLMYQPTDKFPIRSRIPQLLVLPVTPRKKVDRLIQYRRWKDAMQDCLHPSKLPLTKSFRHALVSAVTEERSLHWWRPPPQASEEPQTVLWSHDFKTLADILKHFGYVDGGHTEAGREKHVPALTVQVHRILCSIYVAVASWERNAKCSDRSNLECRELEVCVGSERYSWNSCRRCVIISSLDFYLCSRKIIVQSSDCCRQRASVGPYPLLAQSSSDQCVCLTLAVNVCRGMIFNIGGCKRQNMKDLLHLICMTVPVSWQAAGYRQTEISSGGALLSHISSGYLTRAGIFLMYPCDCVETIKTFQTGFAGRVEFVNMLQIFSFVNSVSGTGNCNNNSKTTLSLECDIDETIGKCKCDAFTMSACYSNYYRLRKQVRFNKVYREQRNEERYVHIIRSYFVRKVGKLKNIHQQRRLMKHGLKKWLFLGSMLELVRVNSSMAGRTKLCNVMASDTSWVLESVGDCENTSMGKDIDHCSGASATVSPYSSSLFLEDRSHFVQYHLEPLNSQSSEDRLTTCMWDDGLGFDFPYSKDKTRDHKPRQMLNYVYDAIANEMPGNSCISMLSSGLASRTKEILKCGVEGHTTEKNNNSKDQNSNYNDWKSQLSQTNNKQKPTLSQPVCKSSFSGSKKPSCEGLRTGRLQKSKIADGSANKYKKYTFDAGRDVPDMMNISMPRDKNIASTSDMCDEQAYPQSLLLKKDKYSVHKRNQNTFGAAKKAHLESVFRHPQSKLRKKLPVVDQMLVSSGVPRYQLRMASAASDRKHHIALQESLQQKPSADYEPHNNENSLIHKEKHKRAMIVYSRQGESCNDENKRHSTDNSSSKDLNIDYNVEDNHSIIANKNNRFNEDGRSLTPTTKHTQGNICDATREDTSSKITLTCKSQTKEQFDKKANRNPRNTDDWESKGNFRYYGDDTDTYKAAATWNEDTTCSKSLKRSQRRSKFRGFYPDPKVILEMQRKVEILVQSYRDFLEHEKEKQAQERKLWGVDEIEVTSDLTGRKSRDSVTDLLKPSVSNPLKTTEIEAALLSPPVPQGIMTGGGYLDPQTEHYETNNECQYNQFLEHSINRVDIDGEESTTDKFEERLGRKTQKTQVTISNGGGGNQQLSQLNKYWPVARPSVVQGMSKDSQKARYPGTKTPVRKSLIPKPDRRRKWSVSNAVIATCLENLPDCKDNGQVDFPPKQAPGKAGPAYDLLVTYDMQNGGLMCHNLTSVQQEQRSFADEGSQCFTFLVNDNDTCVYTFKTDTVLFPRNDTATVIKSRKSRIPVCVGRESMLQQVQGRLDGACEYHKHSVGIASDERKILHSKKALSEQRGGYQGGPVVDRRKATRTCPAAASKTPSSVAKDRTKRIHRSRIPVAYRHTKQNHQNGSERNRQPFSGVAFELDDMYDIDYPLSYELHAAAGTSLEDAWLGHSGTSVQAEKHDVLKSTNKEVAKKKATRVNERLPRMFTCGERDVGISGSYYQPVGYLTGQSMNVTGTQTRSRYIGQNHMGYSEIPQKNNFDTYLSQSKAIQGVPTKPYVATKPGGATKSGGAIKQLGRQMNVKDKKESYISARNIFEQRHATKKSEPARTIGKPKLSMRKQADNVPRKQSQFVWRSSTKGEEDGRIANHPSTYIEGYSDLWNHCEETDILRNTFHPTLALMSSLEAYKKNMVDALVQTLSKEDVVASNGDSASHSGSVTFKSIPSASSAVSCWSFMTSSDANRTSQPPEKLAESQAELCPWVLPVAAQSAGLHPQSVCVFDSPTSSWCSASVGFDEQLGLPGPNIKGNETTHFSENRGNSSRVKEPQFSRSYSESLHNLSLDNSNGETSSFSTMKNISDLPFTFTSNSIEDLSMFLFNENQCRGSTSRRNNPHRRRGNINDLMISNYNSSNRKIWRISSEPNLSAMCNSVVSQKAWQSKSVIEIHSGSVMAAEPRMQDEQFIMCLNNKRDSFDVGTGKFIQGGTKLNKNYRQTSGAGGIGDIKVTHRQARRASHRPAQAHINTAMGAFLSELHSVFQRKNKLDNSHNKNPREKRAVGSSRIKYSPKSLQRKSKTNLVYVCNDISPTNAQAPERNGNELIIDPLSGGLHDGVPLAQKAHQNDHSPKDLAEKPSPRALPAFANILQFWEGINTMFTWRNTDGKPEGSKQNNKSVNNFKQVASVEDNPTVFHSITDNTVYHGSQARHSKELARMSQGKDGCRGSVNIAAKTTTKQCPINEIDTKKCCEIISFLDSLIKQCQMSRKRSHKRRIEKKRLYRADDQLCGKSENVFPSAPVRNNHQKMDPVTKRTSRHLGNVLTGSTRTHGQKLSQNAQNPAVNVLSSAVTNVIRKLSADCPSISSSVEYKSITERSKRDTLPQCTYKPGLVVGDSPSSSVSSSVELASPRMTPCSAVHYSSSESKSDATFVKRKRPMLVKGLTDSRDTSLRNEAPSVLSSVSDICFVIPLGLDYSPDSSSEQPGGIIEETTSEAHRRSVLRRPHRSTKLLAYKINRHDVLKIEEQKYMRFFEQGRKNQKYDSLERGHRAEAVIPNQKRASKRDKCRTIMPIDFGYSENTHKSVCSAKGEVSEERVISESTTPPIIKLEFQHLRVISLSSSKSTFTKGKRIDVSEEITTDQVNSSELDKLSVSSRGRRFTPQFETARTRQRHNAQTQTLLNTTNDSPARIWLNTRTMSTKKGAVHTQLFPKQKSQAIAETSTNVRDRYFVPVGKRVNEEQGKFGSQDKYGANRKDIMSGENVYVAKRLENKDIITPKAQKVSVTHVNDNCQTGHPDCRTVVLKKTHIFGKNSSKESLVLCKRQRTTESNDFKHTPQRHEHAEAAHLPEHIARCRLTIHMSPSKCSAFSREETQGPRGLTVGNTPECLDKKVQTTPLSSSEALGVRVVRQEPRNREALQFSGSRPGYTAISPPRSVLQLTRDKSLPLKSAFDLSQYTLVKDNKRTFISKTGRKVKTTPASSNKRLLYGGKIMPVHEDHRRKMCDRQGKPNKEVECGKHGVLQCGHLLGISPSDKHLYKNILPEVIRYSEFPLSSALEQYPRKSQQLKPVVKLRDCGIQTNDTSYSDECPYAPVCKNNTSQEEAISLKRGLDLLYSPLSSSDRHPTSLLGNARWRYGMLVDSPSVRWKETSPKSKPRAHALEIDIYKEMMPAKELLVGKKTSMLREPPENKTVEDIENAKSRYFFSDGNPSQSAKDSEKCEDVEDAYKQNTHRKEASRCLEVRPTVKDHRFSHSASCDWLDLASSTNHNTDPNQDIYFLQSNFKPLKSAGKTDIHVIEPNHPETRIHADCKDPLQEYTNVLCSVENKSQEYQSCNSESLEAKVEARRVPITYTFNTADKKGHLSYLTGYKGENHGEGTSFQKVIIPTGSQSKLMKQSSAPCLSAASEIDKYQSLTNVRIPLTRHASSRDVALMQASPRNHIPAASHPNVAINQESSNMPQNGKELSVSFSTAADISKPSGTSSSQRSRDIEIVVGNDISIREFMSYLLNCLQLSSPERSKDEDKKQLSLNSQVRLVIDSILNGQVKEDDQNLNGSKTTLHANKDATKEAETGGCKAFRSQRNVGSLGGQRIGSADLSTKPVSEVNQRIHKEISCKENTSCDLFLPVKNMFYCKQSDCNRGKNMYRQKNNPEQIPDQESRKTADDTPISSELLVAKVSPNVYLSKVASARRKKQQPASSSSASESCLRRQFGRRIRKERFDRCRKHPKLWYSWKFNNIVSKRETVTAEGKRPCVSAPVLNLVQASSERMKHSEAPFRYRSRAVRKLSTDEIILSKPHNCHLDKVIKSDNRVTVTVMPHNKSKCYAPSKTEAGRCRVIASKPLKGLNETLLEKESQMFLCRNPWARQQNVPSSVHAGTLKAGHEVHHKKHRKRHEPTHKIMDTQVRDERGIRSPQIVEKRNQASQKGRRSQHQHSSAAVDVLGCQRTAPERTLQPTMLSVATQSVRQWQHKDSSSSRFADSFTATYSSNSLSGNHLVDQKRDSTTPTAARDGSCLTTDQDLMSWVLSDIHGENEHGKHKHNLSVSDKDEKKITQVIGNVRKVTPPESTPKRAELMLMSDRNSKINTRHIVKLIRKVLSEKPQHARGDEKSGHKHKNVKETENKIALSDSHKSRKRHSIYFTPVDQERNLLEVSEKSCRESSSTDFKACTVEGRVADDIATGPNMPKESKTFPYAAGAGKTEQQPGQRDEKKAGVEVSELDSGCSANVEQFKSVWTSPKNVKRVEATKGSCFEASELESVHSTSLGQFKSICNGTDFPKYRMTSRTEGKISFTNIPRYVSPVRYNTVGTATDLPEAKPRSVTPEGCSFPTVADNIPCRFKTVATSMESHGFKTVATSMESRGFKTVATSMESHHSDELARDASVQTLTGGRVVMSDVGTLVTASLVDVEVGPGSTSTKPPLSPSKKPKVIHASSSVGERSLLQIGVAGSPESNGPSRSAAIQEQSPRDDASEFAIPPTVSALDRPKQNEASTCSSATPAQAVHCNEIKVKAPCSLYTAKKINVSLVNGADGKCVKLLVPPDDGMGSYEIVVEPNGGDDGTAMVVAESGMVHVCFEKATKENSTTEFSTSKALRPLVENCAAKFSTSKAFRSLAEQRKEGYSESASPTASSTYASSPASVDGHLPWFHKQPRTRKYTCVKSHRRNCRTAAAPLTGETDLTLTDVGYINSESINKRTRGRLGPILCAEMMDNVHGHGQYRRVSETRRVQKRPSLSFKMNPFENSNILTNHPRKPRPKAYLHNSLKTNLARLAMADYKRPQENRDYKIKSLAMLQDIIVKKADRRRGKLKASHLTSNDRYANILATAYVKSKGDGHDHINSKFSPNRVRIGRNSTSKPSPQAPVKEDSTSEAQSSDPSEAEKEDSSSENEASDSRYQVTAESTEDDSQSGDSSAEPDISEDTASEKDDADQQSNFKGRQTPVPTQTHLKSKSAAVPPKAPCRQLTSDSNIIQPQVESSLARKTVVKFKELRDCDVFTKGDWSNRQRKLPLGQRPDPSSCSVEQNDHPTPSRAFPQRHYNEPSSNKLSHKHRKEDSGNILSQRHHSHPPNTTMSQMHQNDPSSSTSSQRHQNDSSSNTSSRWHQNNPPSNTLPPQRHPTDRSCGISPPRQLVRLMANGTNHGRTTTQNNPPGKATNAAATLVKNFQIDENNQRRTPRSLGEQKLQHSQKGTGSVEVPVSDSIGLRQRSRPGIITSGRQTQRIFTNRDQFGVQNEDTLNRDSSTNQNLERFSKKTNECNATRWIPVASEVSAEGFFTVAKGIGGVLGSDFVLEGVNRMRVAHTTPHKSIMNMQMQSVNARSGLSAGRWQQQQQLVHAHFEKTQHDATNSLLSRQFPLPTTHINPAESHVTPSWSSRTAAKSHIHEERISGYPHGEPASALWCGGSEVPLRMPISVQERTDSGYSELSTPTENLCDWDRSVRMRLRERVKHSSFKLS